MHRLAVWLVVGGLALLAWVAPGVAQTSAALPHPQETTATHPSTQPATAAQQNQPPGNTGHILFQHHDTTSAFLINGGQSTGISPCTMSPDGTDVRPLPQAQPVNNAIAGWALPAGVNATGMVSSPDGSMVAYSFGQPNCQSIAVCKFQGLIDGKYEPTVVAKGTPAMWGGPSVSYSQPAWSPDGTRLACIRTQVDAKGAAAVNVCIATANGGGCNPITNLPANQAAASPAWCPRGVRIVFCLITSKNNPITLTDLALSKSIGNICVINTDGSGGKLLTRDGADSDPVWLP